MNEWANDLSQWDQRMANEWDRLSSMDAENFLRLDNRRKNNLSELYKLPKILNGPKIILMTATPMTRSPQGAPQGAPDDSMIILNQYLLGTSIDKY